MISSRKVDDLATPAKIRCLNWLWLVKAATGIDVLVVSTLRDNEAQDALYAQGRDGHGGHIVTNARGGESIHNYALAWDVVPLRNGKPVWGDMLPADRDLWLALGGISEACGISWSGRWTGSLRELGHFQFTGGLSLPDLKTGKRPETDINWKVPTPESLPPALQRRFA